MTWTSFIADHGEYVESPILEATATTAATLDEAAGDLGLEAALCTFQTEGAAGHCDEDQVSVPTVGPDGTVYVAFMNGQNQALWEPGEDFEDQYLVVSSSDGGALVEAGLRGGPGRRLARLPDQRRRPPDADRLPGRVWGAGNIVADPTQNGQLYLVFSDNRHGVHDSDIR